MSAFAVFQSSPYRALLGCFAIAMGALNVASFGGGAYWPMLDLITNFAPLLLALSLAACMLAWLAGARRLVLTAVIAAVLPPALTIGVDAVGAVHAPPPGGVPRLKILTINMWSMNQDLSAAEQFIRSEKPQVLLLQETSSKRDRALLLKLEALYPTHVSNHPLNCATHVFSVYPLVERIAGWGCDVASARLTLPPELGGGELVAVSVHVSRNDPGQTTFVRWHMDHLAKQSAVVGGDFNRTPWSWALRRFDGSKGFDRRTHALPTWPTQRRARESWITTPFAVLPIDHVFATHDWRTVSVRRGGDVGSDHYPVIVELTRLH